MPQRRQHVPSLTSLCFSSLVRNVAEFCDEQAAYNTTASGSYVDAKRTKCLSGDVPSILRVNACRSFFRIFHKKVEPLSKDTSMSFKKVALKMIMDLGVAQYIDGINSRILLAVLNPLDAHRLRGLRILDLSDVPDDVQIDLNLFDLSAVIVFIYPKLCTFKHLQVIGKECSNLEVLNVANSPNVTDPGLRALSRCSKLRYVDVSGCSKLTRKGINSFLEANTNVIEFHGWINSREGLTIFTHPDIKVYSNIKRFVLRTNILPAKFAERIVKIFPNLNSFGLSECRIEDLCVLKKLDNLEALELGEGCHFDLIHLKMLALSIGERITSLKMPLLGEHTTYLDLNDLSEILASCPNIENLTFAYKPARAEETLTLPSLRKLKTLKCYLPNIYRRRTIKVKLAEMPELIRFSFAGFKNTREEIEGMIMDEINLPKLKVMDMHFGNSGRLDDFRQIAEEKKIDLTINDFHARRTTDYSFTFGAANLDGSP